MANNVQIHVIEGNLGREPESRFLQNGRQVCNFSVACNKEWTDQQNVAHKETTWYRVAAWGGQAAACQTYLHMGSHVLVEGDMSASAYIDKNGQAVGVLEFEARRVQFLDRPGTAAGDGAANPANTGAPAQPAVNNVPF